MANWIAFFGKDKTRAVSRWRVSLVNIHWISSEIFRWISASSRCNCRIVSMAWDGLLKHWKAREIQVLTEVKLRVGNSQLAERNVAGIWWAHLWHTEVPTRPEAYSGEPCRYGVAAGLGYHRSESSTLACCACVFTEGIPFWHDHCELKYVN